NMTVRDVYLKIEAIEGYSPVEPDDHTSPPIVYRRDCMRNMGHEDGTIPNDEVDARRLTALIYREYLDPHYLVPKPVNSLPNRVLFTSPAVRTVSAVFCPVRELS